MGPIEIAPTTAMEEILRAYRSAKVGCSSEITSRAPVASVWGLSRHHRSEGDV